MVYRMINPTEIKSGKTPDDYNLNYEEINFKSSDGVNLSGWFLNSFQENAPTIILMHGYPAESGDMLTEASFLVRDFNVFMFDFRGLGQSEGATTLGAKEVNDLQGAINYLKEEKEVNNVHLWGFSMGAGTALQVTPKSKEVVAVVSDSSFASMEKSLRDLFPGSLTFKSFKPFIRFWAKILVDVNLEEVSPNKMARDIEVPVYLLHSINDPIIPINHGRELKNTMSDNEDLKVEFIDSDYHGAFSGSKRESLRNFLKEN